MAIGHGQKIIIYFKYAEELIDFDTVNNFKISTLLGNLESQDFFFSV